MATVEEMLRNFEQRLESLERRLATTPSVQASTVVKVAVPVPPALPHVRAQPSPAESEDNSFSIFGIIGILFIIIAAVFFVKLSIDSGWLTPTRQILIAAFFGITILLLPHFVEKLADAYGSLLSGTGVVILHLTWFVAFRVHALISMEQALIMATLIGVFSMFLNAQLAHRAFALVSIAGTYFAALLAVNSDTANFLSIAPFVLIWNISFSALSFVLKRREILVIAGYFAVLAVSILSRKISSQPDLAATFLIYQIFQFAIFAVGMFLYSVLNHIEMKAQEAWATVPLLLLLYINVKFLIGVLHPELGPWLGIGLGAIVLLFYQLAKARFGRELPSAGPLYAFAAIAFFQSAYIELTPLEWKPLFSLGIAVLLACFSPLLSQKNYRPAFLVLFGIFLYGALLSLGGELSSEICLRYNIAFGLGALFLCAQAAARTSANVFLLMLGFAHCQVLLAVYRLSLIVSFGNALFVSVVWGLYGAAILFWAYRKRDQLIGNSAVLILSAVSLKAAFYDLWNTGQLIRVLSLLFAGLLLYSCGWIYQRIQRWG